MCRVALAAVLLSACWHAANGLSAVGSDRVMESRALCEWLLTENRCSLGLSSSPSVELGILDDPNKQGVAVTTTRSIKPGEILFRLHNTAIWSVAAAYSDRDLGGKLRDLSVRAGPGFEIVALSGAVAAERVRGYRTRRFQGLAPESAGSLVPSLWGGLARWLWSIQDETEAVLDDQDIAGPIQQGIQLLVPLLDVSARRAWTAAPQSQGKGDIGLLEDGGAISWSRRELEDVARSAFGLVLSLQRPPPPFLLEGIGTLIPEPFVNNETPEAWSDRGESLALVPLVDAVVCDDFSEANAVLGTPPKKRAVDDSLWCVATRKLDAGERVAALDPWALSSS